MPSYPLTFPTLLPESVDVVSLAAQSASRSPTSFDPQIYDWLGRAFKIVVTIQMADATDAAIWGAFFRDLDGLTGTFAFDLDPWCPGWSPAPGTRIFRLISPDQSWRSRFRRDWNFTFEAIDEGAAP